MNPSDEHYQILNEIYENDEEKYRKGVKNNMPKTIDYEDYDIPSGGSGFYFKPQEGKNRIRLVTKPMEVRYYEEGSGSTYKTTLLEDNEEAPEGKKVKVKYAYLILDREDNNRVKVYEATITVFRQIMEYATDKEYGNPTMYDITISRKGSGKNTEYTVIASPTKEDLTEEEVKAIAEADQLEDVYSNESDDSKS